MSSHLAIRNQVDISGNSGEELLLSRKALGQFGGKNSRAVQIMGRIQMLNKEVVFESRHTSVNNLDIGTF